MCVKHNNKKHKAKKNRKKKKELSNFRKFHLFDNLETVNIFMTTGLPA